MRENLEVSSHLSSPLTSYQGVRDDHILDTVADNIQHQPIDKSFIVEQLEHMLTTVEKITESLQ